MKKKDDSLLVCSLATTFVCGPAGMVVKIGMDSIMFFLKDVMYEIRAQPTSVVCNCILLIIMTGRYFTAANTTCSC